MIHVLSLHVCYQKHTFGKEMKLEHVYGLNVIQSCYKAQNISNDEVMKEKLF